MYYHANPLLFHLELTEQVNAGRGHLVLRDMVVFVGLQFFTHTPTDEVLNHCVSALSLSIFHGFLNLWKKVLLFTFYVLKNTNRNRKTCHWVIKNVHINQLKQPKWQFSAYHFTLRWVNRLGILHTFCCC